MYTKIDTKAIDWAEKISHKVQIWTGKTNFYTSKVLAIISTIFIALPILLMEIPSENGFLVLLAKFTLLVVLTGMFLFLYTWKIITFDESSILQKLEKGFSNPAKIDKNELGERFAKFIMIFFQLSLEIFIFQDNFFGLPLFWLFLWLALIFKACNPLPPSESKIRQKINSFKASLAKPQIATAGASAFHQLR